MRKYLGSFLLLTVLLLGCKNDQRSGNSDNNLQADQEPAGNVAPPDVIEDSREARLLTTDFWVFEFYVAPDEAARKANKGRWYSFSPDGKFETGVWQEKTTEGTWRIDRREGKVFIQIDAENDAEDTEWEIQGINKQEDTMTWVGTANYGKSNVIIKAISLLTRPTKAQFGVQE